MLTLGRPLLRGGAVDSTMHWAREAVERDAVAPGAVLVADAQTAGRGRHGRAWLSLPGKGLYLTAVLPGSLAFPAVTLAGALAVAEAAERACGVETRVKWPNDLVAGARKWGGLLAEVVPRPGGVVVLLGVGLNVGHAREDLGPELAETATSLTLLAGGPCDREELLVAVLERLAARLATCERLGFGGLAEDFRARSAFAPGDRLELEAGGAARVATFRGLDGDGRLLLEEDPRPVASATVTRVRKVEPS